MDFAVPAVLIIDLEINPKTDTVFKIGAYRPDLDLGFERSFHHEEGFRKALAKMLPLAEGAEWLMGHNFLEHDLPYLKKAAPDPGMAFIARYRYAEAVAARLSPKPVPPPD